MEAITLNEVLELKRIMQLPSSRRPEWFYKGTGICHKLSNIQYYITRPDINVNTSNFHLQRILEKHFKTWKHFSGDLGYPIPSLSECLDAEDKYCSVKNLYDRRNPYCKLRYDLVDHIIKQMKAELK